MKKNIMVNIFTSFAINFFLMVVLFIVKEKLSLIQFIIFTIIPILISVILCCLINKGKNISQKNKLKINIIYFIFNTIFYAFLWAILRDGTIINNIIAQTQPLQSEYITVSKNSNFLLSFVIFIALSFFSHKLVIDRT